MSAVVVAAWAALALGSQPHVGPSVPVATPEHASFHDLPSEVHGHGVFHGGRGRHVLVPPSHPYGVVDSVRRPGFNGRLWTTRPIIGGVEFPFHTGFGEPGPEAYGEYDSPYVLIPVRVGLLQVTISPWERQPTKELERGRQQWLREQNYTGGVRTFVNDLTYWGPVLGIEPAAEPEPAAIIPIPEDMPRMRHRIQVDASDPADAVAILRLPPAPMRVSWPMNTPAEVLARAERTAWPASEETQVAADGR